MQESTEPRDAERSTSPRRKKKRSLLAKRSEMEARQKRSRSTKLAILVAVLAIAVAGFAMTRRGRATAAWKVGSEVPVDITLVAADAANLACASGAEVAGKHCAFETTAKRSSKGDADDKTLLRPYTTTDGRSFLGAGLWTEPALGKSLPSSRFHVSCTFVIEGKLANPQVRWLANGLWNDTDTEWYAGTVKSCSAPATGR